MKKIPGAWCGKGRENGTTVSKPYRLDKLMFAWFNLRSCSCIKEEVHWPNRPEVLKPQGISQFSRKQLLLPTILFGGWGKAGLYCPGFPFVLHPAVQLMITTWGFSYWLAQLHTRKNRLLFSFHWHLEICPNLLSLSTARTLPQSVIETVTSGQHCSVMLLRTLCRNFLKRKKASLQAFWTLFHEHGLMFMKKPHTYIDISVISHWEK